MPIKIKDLSFYYNKSMSFEYAALKNINLELKDGLVYGIIGKTGSGKSTLVQHLNALLLPQEGVLEINQHTLSATKKNKNLKKLRQEVGLVFQFSEYQLFEETVLKDVAFGPKNFGYASQEALEKAKKALELVGLEEKYYHVSPFDLSGGQKRKVAIAGILAIDPKIMILDEPSVGLDPQSGQEILKLLSKLNKELNKTIILVTHDYELLYEYVDRVILLDNAQLICDISVKELFNNTELVQKYDIEKPNILKLRDLLRQRNFKLDQKYDSLELLIKSILEQL